METKLKEDAQVDNPILDLQSRRDELVKRRAKTQRYYYLLFAIAVFFLVVAPMFAWDLYKNSTQSNSSIWLVPFVYALLPAAILPSYRIRLTQVEADIQELDFQIDLQQFDVSKQERRAEKILRLNDFQLRRYYDLNLRQNSWVFGLGVFCIVLGVIVIGVTLFLVIDVATTIETKIITAALGAVGSILTNFVAAIYLKMNAAATENLTAFHSRLVETQKLLLGNLLASRIEDDEKRWDTLSQLSLHLIEKGRD